MSPRGLLVQFDTGDESSQDGGRMVDTGAGTRLAHSPGDWSLIEAEKMDSQPGWRRKEQQQTRCAQRLKDDDG